MQVLFLQILLFFREYIAFPCLWGNFGTDSVHAEEIVLPERLVNDDRDGVLSDLLLQIIKQVRVEKIPKRDIQSVAELLNS